MLNVKGEVEMDAIVMDGKTLDSGAVSAVRNIANPIQLARLVMDKVCRPNECKLSHFSNCHANVDPPPLAEHPEEKSIRLSRV